MLIACLQSEINTGEVAATFEKKAESANLLPFTQNGCLFMWGAYFCIGAYKCDVVVVIKMGTYIHGVLFCVAAYSDFMVCSKWIVPTDNMQPKLRDNFSCHL